MLSYNCIFLPWLRNKRSNFTASSEGWAKCWNSFQSCKHIGKPLLRLFSKLTITNYTIWLTMAGISMQSSSWLGFHAAQKAKKKPKRSIFCVDSCTASADSSVVKIKKKTSERALRHTTIRKATNQKTSGEKSIIILTMVFNSTQNLRFFWVRCETLFAFCAVFWLF